jgi:hypothetical protein
MGAKRGKLDADIRTSDLFGTPSVHAAHGYYSFAVEDRWGPVGAYGT